MGFSDGNMRRPTRRQGTPSWSGKKRFKISISSKKIPRTWPWRRRVSAFPTGWKEQFPEIARLIKAGPAWMPPIRNRTGPRSAPGSCSRVPIFTWWLHAPGIRTSPFPGSSIRSRSSPIAIVVSGTMRIRFFISS